MSNLDTQDIKPNTKLFLDDIRSFANVTQLSSTYIYSKYQKYRP